MNSKPAAIAPQRRRRGLIALAALAVVVCTAAVLLPLPSPVQIRDWAHASGPWLPVVFFLAYALFTIAPIPRTAFTLSSGLLFGPVLGITIAVTATVIAAITAFLLVRGLGRETVAARLAHPAVSRVNSRLAARGWLAVGSLRLIPVAPFSVVNYCCAVSAVRLVPYTVATLVAVIPGTTGLILLTNALTGSADPRMLLVSAAGLAAGVVGLIADTRRPVRAANDGPHENAAS